MLTLRSISFDLNQIVRYAQFRYDRMQHANKYKQFVSACNEISIGIALCETTRDIHNLEKHIDRLSEYQHVKGYSFRIEQLRKEISNQQYLINHK